MYRMQIAVVAFISAAMPAATVLGDTYHVPGDHGTS